MRETDPSPSGLVWPGKREALPRQVHAASCPQPGAAAPAPPPPNTAWRQPRGERGAHGTGSLNGKGHRGARAPVSSLRLRARATPCGRRAAPRWLCGPRRALSASHQHFTGSPGAVGEARLTSPRRPSRPPGEGALGVSRWLRVLIDAAGPGQDPAGLGAHAAEPAGAAPREPAPGTAPLGLRAAADVSPAARFRQGHREFLQDVFRPRAHAGEEAAAGAPAWPWHPGRGRRPLFFRPQPRGPVAFSRGWVGVAPRRVHFLERAGCRVCRPEGLVLASRESRSSCPAAGGPLPPARAAAES